MIARLVRECATCGHVAGGTGPTLCLWSPPAGYRWRTTLDGDGAPRRRKPQPARGVWAARSFVEG